MLEDALRDDTEGPCDAVNCDLVTAQGLGMRPLHCDMMIPLLLVFNLFICNGVPFYLVYIYTHTPICDEFDWRVMVCC